MAGNPDALRSSAWDAALLTSVVLWASTVIAAKYAISHGLQPLAYIVPRQLIAAVLMFGAVYAFERSIRVSGVKDTLLLAAAGTMLALNLIALVYALEHATASTVSLIFGLTPVFIVLIATAAGLERLSLLVLGAALVSFTGVALVAAGAEGEVGSNMLAVVLATIMSVMFAGYSVAVTPLVSRYSPFRIGALTHCTALIPLALVGGWDTATEDWTDLGWLVWVALVYSAVVTLSVGVFFKGIERVGPSRASVFVNVQPFAAVALGMLVLRESLSATQAVGGLTITAGLILSRRARH